MRRIFVLACVLMGVGSNCQAQDVNLADCRSLAAYFSSAKQLVDAFRNRDLDGQFTLYICSRQHIHPPVLHLAGEFASGGERAAGFLLGKLRAGVREATALDILQVLAYMKIDGTYDAEADATVMRLVEEKIEAIRDPARQSQAQYLLGWIRRPAGQQAPRQE